MGDDYLLLPEFLVLDLIVNLFPPKNLIIRKFTGRYIIPFLFHKSSFSCSFCCIVNLSVLFPLFLYPYKEILNLFLGFGSSINVVMSHDG